MFLTDSPVAELAAKLHADEDHKRVVHQLVTDPALDSIRHVMGQPDLRKLLHVLMSDPYLKEIRQIMMDSDLRWGIEQLVADGDWQVGCTSCDFVTAYQQAADRGWSFEQHSNTTAEHNAHISAMETVNAVTPIGRMRWSLTHVFEIDDTQLNRLMAIGAGVTVQDQRYFWPGLSGPPLRRIVDSGIHVGGGTDSTALCPMSPWIALYFMVTGLNGAGTLVNPGQQITRMEALRLYTSGSAWFSFDDDEVGSLEVGKLADLVVLSADYLSIPQDDIKSITSLSTLLGGRIVHAQAPF